MPVIYSRLLLLAPLLVLAGCATLPGDSRGMAPIDGFTQAVQAGDCRAAYQTLGTAGTVGPDQRLTVGQLCLQNGDFVRARRASADFLQTTPEHPDADYAAYLHALAGFGEWSRAVRADPKVRVDQGRELFREIATYTRERPMSEYVEDLAPRLVRLREGIAGGEIALAERDRRDGQQARARARAEYVLEYYPRTQAAADAARLLIAFNGT